jgi:hypothetical protein
MFGWPCIVIYQCDRTKKCTICLLFIMIINLYMFRAPIYSSSGGTVYTTIGIFCGTGSTSTLLATSWQNTHKIYQLFYYSASWWWVNRCSKYVEVNNHNKLEANSAFCWSYYTDTKSVNNSVDLRQNSKMLRQVVRTLTNIISTLRKWRKAHRP